MNPPCLFRHFGASELDALANVSVAAAYNIAEQPIGASMVVCPACNGLDDPRVGITAHCSACDGSGEVYVEEVREIGARMLRYLAQLARHTAGENYPTHPYITLREEEPYQGLSLERSDQAAGWAWSDDCPF